MGQAGRRRLVWAEGQSSWSLPAEQKSPVVQESSILSPRRQPELEGRKKEKNRLLSNIFTQRPPKRSVFQL